MTKPLKKILLVDDDKVTNLLHKRQIARHGLAQEVDIVTDGLAALDYLKTCAEEKSDVPELVLLDINMPRMNGFEFLQEYVHLPDEIKDRQRIVVVSTSMLRRDQNAARENPYVDSYEVKPLSEEDFERIVNK